MRAAPVWGTLETRGNNNGLPEQVQWLAERVKNHESVYGGIAIHFVQEDEPDAIGFAIADWHRRHMGQPVEGGR